MTRKVQILANCFLALFLTAGCATPVKQAVCRRAIEIGRGEDVRPIQFKKIVVKLDRGTPIGSICVGLLCIRQSSLVWRGGRVSLSPDDFTEVFAEELTKANYPVVGDPDALFDDPSAWKAELLVGGLVKRMQANICYPNSGFGDWITAKGEAFIEVDWQIYSRLQRNVVYETTTEGSGKIDYAAPGADMDVLLNAFSMATQNLLADDGFNKWVTKSEPTPDKPLYEPLSIADNALFEGSISNHINEVRAGVATVFAGEGHGSGFFISSEGILLTNAHVVGGAKFVKVKIATGRELLAEVLRTNSRRDVALVKVEEGNMMSIPVRTTEANVGEEVYAIGSPLDEKYDSTMSKGIVSGYRLEDGMKFIQSDVNVLPGSSGGPLVDANGNTIGITSAGILLANAPTGLNFFVPIADALAELSVHTKNHLDSDLRPHTKIDSRTATYAGEIRATPPTGKESLGTQLEEVGPYEYGVEERKAIAAVDKSDLEKAKAWLKESHESLVECDWREAIRTASLAISFNSSLVDAYLNRAVAYCGKGFHEKAIEDCIRALELQPNQPLQYGGDWNIVIDVASKALELDPQNEHAYAIRSMAFANSGSHCEAAIGDCTKALEINPTFAFAYYNRGFALERVGRGTEAARDYQKSCSLGSQLGCQKSEQSESSE